jgi:hypothetical protein
MMREPFLPSRRSAISGGASTYVAMGGNVLEFEGFLEADLRVMQKLRTGMKFKRE